MGSGEDGLAEMTLKDEWDRLDAETRKWLLDNPGCALVPHTLTTRIQQNSATHVEVDGHGQMILSREDLDFIRDKGTGVGAAPISDELRFYDATQPGTS
jgi:hypothetical protein